jgi:hypothetical protein
MKDDQPLSVLTASLLSELARSGAEAERRQRNAYAELAAEVAVPAEVQEERAAGTTPEEQKAIAEAYLSRLGLRTRRGQKEELLLDDPARLLLAAEFAGVVAFVDGAELAIDDVLEGRVVERRTLLAFITAALRREARRHYLQTQTLLRDGLPHATIRSGRLTTKVILDTADDGRLVARLANEKNATNETFEAISELTFDFTVDQYPPMC